jgi:glutathione peroxidase
MRPPVCADYPASSSVFAVPHVRQSSPPLNSIDTRRGIPWAVFNSQSTTLMTINRLLRALVIGASLASAALLGSTSAPAQTPAVGPAPIAASNCPAVLQKTFKKLQDESDQSLCQYAGKVILVVNTASFCGYTSQYEGLEALYAKYSSRGLVILGFPSNDFEQEPGSNKDIADFCYNTYGVKFPMFAKTSVVGKNANPLYVDLAKTTNKRPEWNFHKYLLDRNGKPVDSFASVVSPTDRRFVSEVERLLDS